MFGTKLLKGAWVMMLIVCANLTIQADELSKTFTAFTSSAGLGDNAVQAVLCTKTGRLLVTTKGHVNFYNGVRFNRIDPAQGDAYKLNKYRGYAHSYFDKHHHLWLKDQYKVVCVNLMKEKFEHNVGAVFGRFGYKKPVEDLFVDALGQVWLVNGRTLYNVETKRSVKLDNKELQDVEVFNDRFALFYDDGQMDVYDFNSFKFNFRVQLLSHEDRKSFRRTSVVTQAPNGFFQIKCNDKGSVLTYVNLYDRQVKMVQKLPEMRMNNIIMHNNKLYISAEEGYFVYDMMTDEMEHVRQIRMYNGKMQKTCINMIAFDRQGGMWLGTRRRGLLYSKPYPTPFITYGRESTFYKENIARLQVASRINTSNLPNSQTHCSFVDSRGWKWFGTFSGLQLQQPGVKEPRHIVFKDGLVSEVVCSIAEDENNNIWVGTTYGIAHVDIKNDKINQILFYDQIDGIPNETFIDGASMKLSDGTILMQSIDHIVAFNPESFHVNAISKIKLYPKLVKILMNGIDVESGKDYDDNVVTQNSVSRTRDMSFNYDQNFISLTFNALNYFRPLQTFYRVRVEGYEPFKNWTVFSHFNSQGLVDKSGALHLVFPGLQPGNYRIELQASMSPDHWSTEAFVWNIQVKVPWWRSTLVYTLLSIIILTLLTINVVWYNRNTRLRMEWNGIEGIALRRCRTYLQNCLSFKNETLAPVNMQNGGVTEDDEDEKLFQRAMLNILAKMDTHEIEHATFKKLAQSAGIEITPFCMLISKFFYRNPRRLVAKMQLQSAAQMLRETRKSIADISEACRFDSPNFFIACFYHEYRTTPKAYRDSNSR